MYLHLPNGYAGRGAIEWLRGGFAVPLYRSAAQSAYGHAALGKHLVTIG